MSRAFFVLTAMVMTFLVGCATPSVSKKLDPFSGGEVVSLRQNQLNTPGFGDIYFDLEAVKSTKNTTLTVLGTVDYEVAGEATIKIDQTKDFVALVDGERIPLKPIKESYNYHQSYGMAAPLHVQTMKYEISPENLKKIASAKIVSMKMFAQPHRDDGFTGSFDKRNFDKLNEFIKSLGL